MGDQSPGQNASDIQTNLITPNSLQQVTENNHNVNPNNIPNNDVNMKINVKDLLPPHHREILDSLHQINPTYLSYLKEIEENLISLRVKHRDDLDIAREIEYLHYKIRGYQNKKLTYNNTDSGPFTVIVESLNKDGRGLHPIDLGKKLFTLKIDNISKIIKKGFNRVGVSFSNYSAANNLLYNEKLTDEGYKAFIPQRLLTCKGIIKDIGQSIVEEDIINEARCKTRILEAHRLNRRVVSPNGEISFVPSRTFLVTFEGKKRPEEISLFSYYIKVEHYVPPVSQCRKCLRFGHSMKQCRSKTKCPRCGSIEHQVNDCKETMKCIFCHGDHLATDRNCKEFKRQKNINELMAFHDYSYYEATQLVPPLIARDKPERFVRSPQAFPISSLSQIPTTQNHNNAPLTYARVVSQTKRRKHTIVEKDNKELAEIRHNQYPQPTRTPSPNGVAFNTSYRVSPNLSHISVSSPSPSFSTISALESPHSNPPFLPSQNWGAAGSSERMYNLKPDNNIFNTFSQNVHNAPYKI